MKKIDSFKTLTRTMQSLVAMVLVTLMAVGNLVGQTTQTYSYTFTQQVWTAEGTQTLDGLDWTVAGTGQGAFNFSSTKGQQFGTAAKPYSALSLSTDGIDGIISSVKVNTSGAASVVATFKVKVGDTYFTYDGADEVAITATATDYTFTGSASGEVVLEWAQTSSKALYVKSIEITYVEIPPAVETPVITPATGTYYASQTVTITCATAGANIYYTIDGSTPTANSTLYTAAITVDSNMTIKAIGINSEGNSRVATATYTFPAFTELANLAAFKRETSTSTLFKVNSDMTVLFQTEDKYHTFVQDDSAAIYVYGTMDKAYNAGDVITGGMFGKFSIYSQMKEMRPVTGTPIADGVAGAAVEPIVVTIADLLANYDNYEGKLVTVQNAKVAQDVTFQTGASSGVEISQDTNIIQIYTTFKNINLSLMANDNVTVTGLVLRHNDIVEIAPRSNEDLVVPFASTPYTLDFDANTDSELMLTNGEATNKWFVGQAQGFDNNKLFISSTNGTTNKYDVTAASNVKASRAIVIPNNGAVLTFTSRVNGEEGQDMLNVYLYNYTDNILNTTPSWQTTLVGENEWTEHTYPISAENAGQARLVFEWVNNGSNGEQFPAAIDNISVVEATCAQPLALNAVVDSARATITWTPADTTQTAWTFEYKLEDHSEWYAMRATTPTVSLSDLQGSSVYDMRVKANCGEESSDWTEGQFSVGCLNPVVVRIDSTMTIGASTSTNNYVPFYYNYSFGYSQQIYTASELNATEGGTIKSIKFYVSSGGPNNAGNIRIWLGHTNKEVFDNTTDYINPSNLTLVCVKDGAQTFTQGWNEFVFDTPFNYNGTDNIVVAYYEGYPNYGGSTSFATHTATNMVLYQYSDGTGYSGGYTDPDHTYVNYEDPANSSTSSKYRNSNRNQLQFIINVPETGCNDQLACDVPTNVTVKDITTEEATITWNGDAESYALEYKTGEEEWTAVIVNDTIYTLTGLTQKTTYTVRVKAICGENNYSLYTDEVEFTTASLCPIVTDITSSNLSTTTTISWTPGGEENSWIVRFRPEGTTEWVELPTISGIASTTFGGLLDQTDYELEIMALCDPDDEENQSSWAPYTFTSGCAAFDLPYVEEFEDVNTPNCWTSEEFTFNGTQAEATEAGQWLMSPPITVPAEGNTYIVMDVQGSVNIQASYRGTALNRFAEIGNVANIEEMSHLIFQVPDLYKDKAVNFLFLANGEATIETIEFTQCAFVPAEVTAYDPTNTSVELTWNGINNNGWILEYAEEGSEEWTSVNIDATSDSVQYTLTGLTGATTYNIRVRTVCAGGSVSQPSEVATATTHCDPISAPYTHFSSRNDADFECWNNYYSGTYENNGARIAANNDMRLYNYYNKTTDAADNTAFGNVYAVLPKFDTTLNVLQINFTTEQWTSNNTCKFQLGVVTDVNHPVETFRTLQEYSAGENPASYTYILNNATDGNLAFRLLKDTLTQEVRIRNILVEYIPACQRPSNMVITDSNETTLVLNWNTIGIQRNWDIKYMQTQFDFNPETQGTLVTANLRPRIITNLEYGEYYTFYIRNHCSATEQSDWVGPFTHKLEMNYNIAEETAITTCNGNIIYEAVESEDTTTTVSSYTMVVNPSSDGRWISLNGDDVQLNGATLSIYDGAVVDADKLIETYTDEEEVHVTPLCATQLTLELTNIGETAPVLNLAISCDDVPTCSAPSTPEFDIETLTLTWEAGCWGTPESYNIEVMDGTTETTTTLTSTTTSLVWSDMPNDHSIVFRVQPVCGGENGDWSEESEEYIKFACGAPTEITATENANHTATITWTPFYSTQHNFEVGYKLHDAYTWNTATVNNATTFTTPVLEEAQTYDVRVKAICGEEVSEYITTTLNTECVTIEQATGIITLGEGTGTSNYLPSYSYYNYSLTQQIYTSAEIGMSGAISSVAFYNGGSTKTRTYDVYLAHTDKTSFSGASDWVPVTANDKVFTGEVTLTAGQWTTLTFTSSFQYNGTDNLLLVVDDNTDDWSSGLACRTYSATSQAIRVYSDYTDYDPESPSSYSGAVQTVKNQVQFNITGVMCNPVVSCPAPSNLELGNADMDHVTMSWSRGGNETSWTVVYKLNDGEEVSTTATDTFLTITGLEGSTAYTLQVGVYANCDETHQSEGVTEEFSFSTPACLGGTLVDFHPGTTSTSSYVPFNGLWNYAYSQQIFDASELNINAGTITAISFNCTSVPTSSTTGGIHIWMGHTNKTSFTSNTDYVDVSTLREVLAMPSTQNRPYTLGWNTFNLETPFEYDGTSNLVVAYYEGYPNYSTGYFQVHSTTDYKSIYHYSDNETYVSYTDPATANGSKAYGKFRNNIQLELCPAPTCTQPNSFAFNDATNTLTWQAGENGTPNSYTLQYREAGTEDFTTVTVTEPSYAFTNLDFETTYEYQVQADCGQADGQSSWTTLMTFTTSPACSTPTDFTYNFSTNKLGWSGDANSYILQYRVAGAEEFTTITVTGTSYTFTNIVAGTVYELQMQADCGEPNGRSNWTPLMTLTIPADCDVAMTVPFTEGFEATSPTLSCWKIADEDGDGYTWGIASHSVNNFTVHGGDRCAISASYDNDAGLPLTPDNWLISPAIAITGPVELSYWLRGQDASYAEEHYSVYVATADSIGAFKATTPVDSGYATGDYEMKSIVLDNYAGQTIYIAFRHHNVTDMFYLNLDDVSVVALPTCFEPQNVNVTEIATNSATVTWTDALNQGNYAVEYKEADATTWTVLTGDTSRTVTLSGLAEATNYVVRIKTVCSATDESEYTDEVSFTTTALPATLPYNFDFSDATETARWQLVNGTTTNQWYIGNATGNGDNSALYVSNDEGVTNAYTISNVPGYVWAYRDIDVDPAYVYHLSFDWKGQGETQYDYMYVFVGARNEVTAVSGTNAVQAPANTTQLRNPLRSNNYFNQQEEWTTFTYDLDSTFAGQKRIYFCWRNDNSVGTNPPAAVDNISIVSVDKDLVAVSIDPIADACDLSNAKVAVTVKNNTMGDTIRSFVAMYQLNDDTVNVVTETVTPTAPILPGETYKHIFATTPAFVDGSNNITVTLVYEGEEDVENNVMKLNDVRQVVPATVPYEQDFANVVLGRDAWTQGTENENPKLWTNNDGVMTFMDNDTMAAQNYFITHCIEIPEGQVQISYDYNALSSLSESMNVYMGTTPDITTMTLIGSHTDFNKADEDYTYNYLFNNDNAGVYYIAVEAASQAGNMGITFDNLTIMPMIDVTVTAGPNGTVSPLGLVKVPYNGDLTISIIPDNMYHTAGVWVDGERVMNEDPFNASYMMYTLSNITETHTINVEFKMEFHINKYVYNFNDQYAEDGGHFVPAHADTLFNPSGHVVTMVPDEHYTLYSLVVGTMPPASEGALIEGDNVIADVVYDTLANVYTYTFDTMYVSNYYVQACFKMDTVNIHYRVLTGAGIFDGATVAAGESHDTWVDYGADHTSTIQAADGYYTMAVTVNAVNEGIIDHYDFDSVVTTQYVTAQFGHMVTASISNYNGISYLGSDEVRGTIEPDTQMVLSGGSCSVSGTVQEHFHLQSFLVNGVDMLASVDVDGNEFTFTIDSLVENTNIVAEVQIDQVAIYYTVDGGNGFVNGNEMNAVAHDTLYIDYMSSFLSTFEAAEGYHIENINVNGESYDEIPQWLTEFITTPQDIVITFALNEYDITTTIYGNGTVSPGVHVVYDLNSSYVFTATPEVGYHISQILRNNVSLPIEDPEGTYTETIAPVINNYDYVVYVMPNIYTVTASAGENGTIDPYGVQSYEYGSTPTFTVIPDAGYEIDEVLVDGEAVTLTNGAYTFEALTENHTISATFTRINFTITATAGVNGTITPSGEITVVHGSMQAFAIAPAVGYEIADVTVDGESVGAVSTYVFEQVTADHTINATFSKINLTIAASAGANGTITPSGNVTVEYGEAQAFTVEANDGYVVDYVTVDGMEVYLTNNTYTFNNVTENHSIFVAFKPATYTITVTDPENGTITPNGVITVGYHATPTFTVMPTMGYNVKNIKVDNVDVLANAVATVMGGYTYTFPAVEANHTLTAEMEIMKFNIVATAGANGSITPSGTAQVNYGENSATYSMEPADGYMIDKVLVDGVNMGAINNYTFYNVTANHTISVTFKVEPCVVPTNLHVINIDTTSATLTWYHPSAASYDIQYKTTSAATWTLVQNVPGFAYNLTNLQANTNYVCKVKANTPGCDDESWSNAITFKTNAAPTTPDGIADYVKNHVNVYAEHNRVHIVNNYGVDINNVSIYDMYGKQVYSGNAINNPEVIELNVAIGTYVVRLTTEQGPAVYKVHINR